MKTSFLLLSLLQLFFSRAIKYEIRNTDAAVKADSCQGKVSGVPYAVVPSNFCAYFYASNLNSPRGLITVENGDVLVLERDLSQVTVLWDANGDGVSSDSERAMLASADGLNHAVEVHDGYLYASSPTQVYRWQYEVGQRSDLGQAEVVVQNIPCCHHVSRSLVFDQKGFLYVQSGSGSNVDPDSTHARIARFNITGSSLPIQWSKGEVFADGVRNEVGLRFDSQQRLWGVENGCDDLHRTDLGGDIHTNNPSEEMNLFLEPGKFYGYPYCWSQFQLNQNSSHPRGTQWVHENFMKDGIHSDSWCRDKTNVLPPAYNFMAHMAPMDIIFWQSSAFPSSFQGAFVSFHGSWDRQPAAGYRVDHVVLDSSGMPVSSDLFFHFSGGSDTGPNWPHRPVGLATTKTCLFGECLLVASDASDSIISVGYSST